MGLFVFATLPVMFLIGCLGLLYLTCTKNQHKKFAQFTGLYYTCNTKLRSNERGGSKIDYLS